ncbi:MAG: 50S ribosomal protein L25 [bacterium]|nr:50S ribosomal protein L25 [bacterium]
MADIIECSKREGAGTTIAKRLRAAGSVPAILYGHGEESLPIAIPSGRIDPLIESGVQVVEFSGDLSESALIKAIQWDALGMNILHVDFLRVRKGEKVEVTVAIELVGDAQGANDGGIINHILHAVNIECFVTKIPESFSVNISSLGLGEAIAVDALDLPEGAVVLDPADSVIVQCEYQAAESEEGEEGAAGGIEPEVIGRSEDDEAKGDGE